MTRALTRTDSFFRKGIVFNSAGRAQNDLFYQRRSRKVNKSQPISTSLGVWGKSKWQGGTINYQSFWGFGAKAIGGVDLFGGMGSMLM